jgi:ABC-type Na+ efflux pump permease subunit
MNNFFGFLGYLYNKVTFTGLIKFIFYIVIIAFMIFMFMALDSIYDRLIEIQQFLGILPKFS